MSTKKSDKTEEMIETRIAGVTFEGRQELLKELLEPDSRFVKYGSQMLRLEREPDNKYDENAIGVWWEDQKLGFIPANIAADMAPKLKKCKSECYLTSIGNAKGSGPLGAAITVILI